MNSDGTLLVSFRCYQDITLFKHVFIGRRVSQVKFIVFVLFIIIISPKFVHVISQKTIRPISAIFSQMKVYV